MEKTKRTTKPGIDSGDKLSSLPDEILSHILSFLQTKYAVGTSVLSRRWKDLWTRVSALHFDSCVVFQPRYGKNELRDICWGILPSPDPAILKRRDLEFCDFVCKVLSRHKNLDQVRLFSFHFSVECNFLKELSQTRFKRQFVFGALLEEVDIRVLGFAELEIPASFYTLNNLKVAKLFGVLLGAVKESVSLPSVKVLQLCHVEIKHVDSLGRLISGCPVLETAHLENCCPIYRNWEDPIQACSPSLKNLKIIYSFSSWNDPTIVIEAPKLEDLHLQEFAQLKFKGNSSLSCLHSARVDLEKRRSSDRDLIVLLTQISNAKELCLSGQILRPMSLDNGVQLPAFPNLTHLTIRNEGRSLVLHTLLNSASKLKSLAINTRDRDPYGSITWEGLETASTPACLLSSLQVIEIQGLVRSQDDWDMIVYLLRVGAVLKKVNMHLYHRDHEIMGRRDFVSLRKQASGPSHWEARLLLPKNKEILVDTDDEIPFDSDVDDYYTDSDGETDTRTGL